MHAIRLVVAAAAIAIGAPARAQDIRAVVELFTSQGCSSCPPADAQLAKLARDKSVLALSLPVDYWDYLGWKDSLASPAFTLRQKAYATTRGDGQVYTPQVVVDGAAQGVGSDGGEIASILASAGGRALSIPMSVSEADGVLRVAVGAAKAPDVPKSATLWLVGTTHTTTVAIGRGENGGRSVTYTNVVRAMRQVGTWTGAAATFEVPAADARQPGTDGWAVLLQVGNAMRPGVVLAAVKGGAL